MLSELTFTNISDVHPGPCTHVCVITVWGVSWTVCKFVLRLSAYNFSWLVDEDDYTLIKFTPSLWRSWNLSIIGGFIFTRWVIQRLDLSENFKVSGPYLRLPLRILCGQCFPEEAPKMSENLFVISMWADIEVMYWSFYFSCI